MKLILVSGNKNSGKTIFSFFLGAKLSAAKKAIVLHCDSNLPVVKGLLPNEFGKSTKSLGKALLPPIPTKEHILENVIAVEKYQNLGVMSYAPFENAAMFPAPTEQKLMEAFKAFSQLTDYIIVDSDSTETPLSRFAFAHCDSCINIMTADYKGICWRTQHEEKQNVINVLTEISGYNLIGDIKKTFSTEPYVLPYAKTLSAVYNGEDITSVSISKKYDSVISEIAGVVV